MDLEDLEPITKKPVKKDLAPLGIEALNEYIAELMEEIERVKAEIVRKSVARDAAESFFKK